ncbi:UDP-N-acetylenolpyruvoylglucosamine reductase [Putridiphycobacter roseus]|uniref:UDP-N-acetylenolpyruvoylglucosamine reductase n=1 Tax=Putridiphycobacter roseus TaxID=2219161 RepID=A0A2W1N207_9FLAO|nr:UDP-N-acetylmuramate dehydrogenase [Putridiphycobacter roseus]PZE17834.1 UDP-N-acetylenolpyruvoylglucosamine reductase [Putridiphycobacter roseus]
MIQENVNIQAYNTFGVDCTAKYFARFRSIKDLQDILADPIIKSQEILVLGGGSNLLFTKDFEGIVLKNELIGIYKVKEDKDHVWVEAMAGEEWHNLVLFAIDNDFGGIENLSLIPGSVGAAPMQNIGAYGVEIKDVFHELEAIHIETGEMVRFTKKRCKFGYRESIFKHILKGQYIITSVTLKLTKNHDTNTTYGAIEKQLWENNVKDPTIKHISDTVIDIRKSKLPDPALIGNSGSFFKNPVISLSKFEKLLEKYPDIAHYKLPNQQIKLAAGWLIEQAGWKGKTFENYGVHKNQALVLVNYGGAEGKDIYNLSEEILKDIKAKFNIVLEREVNIY